MDKNLFLYKDSKKTFVLIGILTVLQSLAIIAQAGFLAKAIITVYEGAGFSALPFFAMFFLAHVFRHFLQWLKSRIAYRFADQTSSQLQNDLVEKVFMIGPKTISRQGSGHIIALCLEGIPSYKTYLELFIPRFLSCLLIPASIVIYVFTMDVTSAVVLIVVMPILIIFLILLGLVAQKQKDNKWENYQLLSRHFVDSLRGLVTLKFLGRSKGHREAIYSVSNKYRISTVRTLRVAFLSSFSLDFFSSLSVAVVAVELGLRLINGQIDFLAALTILILAPEYFLPVRELGNDYHATMDGKESGEKIRGLLNLDDGEKQVMTVNLPDWNKESELVVRGLTKTFTEENRTVLADIHFTIRGFKKIGIIGLSGAGKSTLIDLLSGFTKPTSGSFFVDGIEIPDFSVAAWQDQVTYIPQHPYIFSGTVKENIMWYAPNATDKEITEAAERTGLSELISQFPNGLDEKIGQGGRVLSGGEEQRIALARALLTNRPIMFFDEPTAHLDIETEHDIKEIMLPLLDNKLVFFATHRLHWMNEMDYILVMDGGRLAESGTPDELLRKNGVFTQLIKVHRGEVS
ncbi:thiol reductant ABC exporter subunit CydD [Caldibacillus thermoamylovorans]|nr:thiol reductant ABC exporter subunit CydD [Caldibacillus thermoamylovorans]